MSKTIGDIFTNEEGKWEIELYDRYTDEYVCHKLGTYESVIKRFREEEMEE